MIFEINPKTAQDYGGFIAGLFAFFGALWTIAQWPFKTFVTKKSLALHEERDEAMFVKKVEADGTRAYVHPEQMAIIEKKLDENIEESQKWRAMAKDWMERP